MKNIVLNVSRFGSIMTLDHDNIFRAKRMALYFESKRAYHCFRLSNFGDTRLNVLLDEGGKE